jgi:hypothetical protein
LGGFGWGLGRRVYLDGDFGFCDRQRHLALTTVATALAAVTTMIAAGVFGAEHADFR